MHTTPPRHVLYAVVSLSVTWALAWMYRHALLDALQPDLRSFKTSTPSSGVVTGEKVATIADTLFSPHLITLMLYYRGVLGPEWPILFYTSQEVYDEHVSLATRKKSTSAAWLRALADGAIEPRIIDPRFNMTTREGVNKYWADPWIWEQLAPAKHVLLFQTDAIICANAHHTVDDFLQYDFIGAPLNETRAIYNGGLSMRNRSLALEIVKERDWWTDYGTDTEYGDHGEDVWMSYWMQQKGANLPSAEEALKFARQLPWHMERPGRSLGYHRLIRQHVHSIPEIRKWCPEIDLADKSRLGGHVVKAE